MRLIGHLQDEPTARVFGDFLLVQGIENTVEADGTSGWSVWISDEDKIDPAKGLLDEFVKDPKNARYKSESKAAPTLRAEKEREQARWEKKVRGRRQIFSTLGGYGLGPLTLVLIVISSIIYVLMAAGGGTPPWIQWLLISVQTGASLPEIRHGQIWRLVTPIFLHFGIWHILFNMLWLRDLGGMLEARFGTANLALLIAGLAVGSNLVQFFIGGHPIFGGMSGVVYGLLGYIWIRGRFDPSCGLFLHPTTILFMLIWFFAAFTGYLGNVANWAHAGGLVMGMAWGYGAAAARR